MNYGLTNRAAGAQGRREGAAAGGRAARAAQRVGAAELLHRRATPASSTPSYSYGYSNRDAERVLADLADRARDADRRRWRSTTGSSTTRCRRRRTIRKLLGMSLNGTLRSPTSTSPAAGAGRRYASRRPASTNANNLVQTLGELPDPAKPYGGNVTFNYDIAPLDAAQPALRRLLQRAVLRRLVRVPGVQLSRTTTSFLLPKDRRFNMSFTLAGRRVVLELLRRVRRRRRINTDYADWDKIDRSHEGTDPQRGQGHAPAPAHLHQRQAAGARRQQAGPVLRHRSAGRSRHHATSASSSATRRRRSAPRSATARSSARRSPTSSRTRRAASRTPC